MTGASAQESGAPDAASSTADLGPGPAPSTKRPSYLVRHWRGDLPLGLSYWVNGLLANVAAFAAVSAIGKALGQIHTNYVSLLVGVSAWIVVAVTSVWQLAGIWRSASRPRADRAPSRWATLAKVSVVLGCLRAIASFVGEGLPALGAAADQARWLDENAKWSVRLLRDGTELEVSGGIGHGFAADLQAALDSHRTVRLVHLNLQRGGLIERLNDPKLDPAKGRRALLGLHAGVMSLPPRDAALMLRFMFAGT